MDWPLFLAIFLITALKDSIFAGQMTAVAHGKTEAAADLDSLGMGVDLISKTLAVGSLLSVGLSPTGAFTVAAYMAGGNVGTRIGMALSAYIERRTGKRVEHRLRP